MSDQDNYIGNRTLKSPLRYPGGKSRALKYIVPYIPQDTDMLISPFLGGGSVEIYFANSGIQVKAFDSFQPLVCFWKEILLNPGDLANNIQQFYPLKKEKFDEFQANLRDISKSLSQIDIATIFYILNRSSFSGTTLSGGMGTSHPRFTQSSIDRVAEFKCPNLSVECLSFEDSLKQITDNRNSIYLDPPYLLKNRKLYGNKGDAHKDFDHKLLHDTIKDKNRWVMSYNNCDQIRKIYSDFRIIDASWSYGMNKSKKSSEILIFSNEIELEKQK